MDVEKEELAGSNNDHDETEELSINRAGMLVFWSLSDMIDDIIQANIVWISPQQVSNISFKENLGLPKSRAGPHYLSISKTAATHQINFTILRGGLDKKNASRNLLTI